MSENTIDHSPSKTSDHLGQTMAKEGEKSDSPTSVQHEKIHHQTKGNNSPLDSKKYKQTIDTDARRESITNSPSSPKAEKAPESPGRIAHPQIPHAVPHVGLNDVSKKKKPPLYQPRTSPLAQYQNAPLMPSLPDEFNGEGEYSNHSKAVSSLSSQSFDANDFFGDDVEKLNQIAATAADKVGFKHVGIAGHQPIRVSFRINDSQNEHDASNHGKEGHSIPFEPLPTIQSNSALNALNNSILVNEFDQTPRVQHTMQSKRHIDSTQEKSNMNPLPKLVSHRRLQSNAGTEISRLTQTIDPAINPLENEAETAILNAIEKMDRSGHDQNPLRSSFQVATGEESRILPGVPDDVVHGFQEPEDMDQPKKVDEVNTTQSEPPTLKSMTEQLRILQNEKTTMQNPINPDGYLLRAQKSTINAHRRWVSSGSGYNLNTSFVIANQESIGWGREKKNEKPNDDNTKFDVEAQKSKNPTSPKNSLVVNNNATPINEISNNPGNFLFRASMKPPGKSSLALDYGFDEEGDSPDDDPNENVTAISQCAPRRRRGKTSKKMSEGREIFVEVYKLKQKTMKIYFKYLILGIFFPVLLTSSLLFYVFDNPLVDDNVEYGSYSWWILFLGARQVVTFLFAKAIEILIVDVFAIRTRIGNRLLGPFMTLMIVQARGWPFLITFWALVDLGMLFGHGRFARHWLYWQNTIDMLNETNPSGLTNIHGIYSRILIAFIVAGIAAAVKRVLLATYFGKKTCQIYGPQLVKVAKKMLLLSEVAHLAREIKFSRNYMISDQIQKSSHLWDFKNARKRSSTNGDDDDDDESAMKDQKDTAKDDPQQMASQFLPEAFRPPVIRNRLNTETSATTHTSFVKPVLEGKNSILTNPSFPPGEELGSSTRIKLNDLVGTWEESERKEKNFEVETTIHDVLQFRQSVSHMGNKFPFSLAFGPAKTREDCIESSQNVFEDLLLHTPGSHVLPFDTIALVALDVNGHMDEYKIKKLIKLLRPDKEGNLSRMDFVKSCDSVYKRMRMLHAAITISGQIDHAAGKLINLIFYFVLGMIVLTICNLNPLALFLSLSGLILSFAFMFGSAASTYFEGILFILLRRPYDIGDRISISNVDHETNPNGSSCWYVENVTLFTTTVRFATTNEVATYANGSLAKSRIINAKRSPKAILYVYFKFGIDVPYERVKLFHTAVESFVQARPREWASLLAFRATRIENDLNFVEYVVVAQHLEAWQNAAAILTSKAELASYCLELSKMLEIRYQAPSLPVSLQMKMENDIPDLEEEMENMRQSMREPKSASDSTSKFQDQLFSKFFSPDVKKKV